ncbi:hypothetical protein PGTUg99_032234 [Puccinia graminis f. sp. tritici]|uniref:Uncharacterized protein n=1 Tax=Puccinia graminis f. sp. tritici TaxID=56615 RepID=A0A5B0RIF3_PUCGR|nr:hypothetical protein PGTUg99_032234 [Puccinia graminis f. sp. tritici]
MDLMKMNNDLKTAVMDLTTGNLNKLIIVFNNCKIIFKARITFTGRFWRNNSGMKYMTKCSPISTSAPQKLPLGVTLTIGITTGNHNANALTLDPDLSYLLTFSCKNRKKSAFVIVILTKYGLSRWATWAAVPRGSPGQLFRSAFSDFITSCGREV